MIGETLGPYLIEAELGSGGMGTVYLATAQERVPGVDVGDRVARAGPLPRMRGPPTGALGTPGADRMTSSNESSSA